MIYNKSAVKNFVLTGFLFATILATTGCSSMLTIGSSDSDGCKGVPDSTGKCMSVMEVYQKTSSGQPLVRMKEVDKDGGIEQVAIDTVDEEVKKDEQKQASSVSKKSSSSVTVITGNNPIPVRMPSKVMRVWINSYESASGDFVAPGYIYTEIEPKKWTMGQKITSDGQKVDPLKATAKSLKR